MSDLFLSLRSASRALDAQRMGLEVTGQNIANVNTPGYSRRVVDFAAVPPSDRHSAGGGTDVVGVRATRDRLLDRRLQQELPAERREAAIAGALEVVQTSLGAAGESVDAGLNAFFDAFSRLADTPTSSVARQEVLLQGETLAETFRDMAQRLETAQRDVDRKIASGIEEVNSLAQQIATLNDSLSRTPVVSRAHLEDEQAGLVRQLSELVDIEVIERESGGVDISFGNGRGLVIADQAFTVQAVPTGLSGLSQIRVGTTTITSEITGGSVGGLLHVRDVNIPDYTNRLDTMAFNVIDAVNDAHTAGYTQGGVDAGDFFAPAAAVAGAARAMAVDGSVAADVSLIAAAGTAQNGDNQTATAIARLRDARVLNGGTTTFTDGWSQLVYRVGRDTQTASAEQSSREEIVRQVDALRDEVSGVSLDEETVQMLKFQRAYEANARFFSAINSAIETLIQTMSI
jgi:flagellar hook-associated protein 1 FlgK